MTTETKILGGVLVTSVALILGAALLLGNSNAGDASKKSGQSYEIDYSKGQKIGSDSAKLKLVEFSDFQCPACKAYEPYVKQVREKNKDQLQFIYRHFPLPQHLNGRPAANFAEYAASEGKFWEAHDKLFETQEKWSSLQNPTEFLVNLGKEIGLDENKTKEALEKSLYNQKISDDMNEGKKLDVNSTPTFYLNGKKLDLKSFSDLDAVVTDELKK